MTSLQTQCGRVEQNLGTVSERESTVTEILSFLFILENLDGIALFFGRLF
jgi:hypothetical protein